MIRTCTRRRVVASVGAVFATLGLGACASVPLGGGAGSGLPGTRRDEMQFIGSYAEVVAVGVSRRLVYAATPSGIGIYDRFLNTWLPPLTRDNGFTDDRVTFMAGDPVEDALWYGVPGAIVMYRPGTEGFQRTIIAGVPDFIAFDRGGNADALVRAGGRWTRVSRVGIATQVQGAPPASSLILPRTLQDVLEQFPALRSGTSFMLRDQRADRPLRNYPVVSGSISPDRSNEVWLGTAGDGLHRVDPAFQQATPLRFGPIESGLGALAIAADGVWAAGLGTSQARAGLSFASNDLQRWRWIDGSTSVPMIGVRSHAMSVRGPRAWIATDRGVVRVRLDGNEEMTAWGALDGLPDERVYAIAARGDGAWAGTARGLVFVSDSVTARDPRTRGLGARLLENAAVYALQPVGDTLWIGTNAGLVALPTANGSFGGTLSRPLGVDPALRGVIRALAWSDTMLLAATENAVLRLAPRGGAEPTRIMALDTRLVGTVTRLAIDERTIVMTGSDGIVVLPRNGATMRVLRVPSDIPAPALDAVLSRDWIWIATSAGLVRLRRAGDGGLP